MCAQRVHRLDICKDPHKACFSTINTREERSAQTAVVLWNVWYCIFRVFSVSSQFAWPAPNHVFSRWILMNFITARLFYFLQMIRSFLIFYFYIFYRVNCWLFLISALSFFFSSLSKFRFLSVCRRQYFGVFPALELEGHLVSWDTWPLQTSVEPKYLRWE
jgi:hypothetical protein